MKANRIKARIERLEQQRGRGLIVAILREGETEAEGRQRVMTEGGYIASPHLLAIYGPLSRGEVLGSRIDKCWGVGALDDLVLIKIYQF